MSKLERKDNSNIVIDHTGKFVDWTEGMDTFNIYAPQGSTWKDYVRLYIFDLDELIEELQELKRLQA